MANNKLQFLLLIIASVTMITACSDADQSKTDQPAQAQHNEASDLETLMKQAEDARAEAEQLCLVHCSPVHQAMQIHSLTLTI